MKYHVTHTSRYAYGTPVDLAAHMLHLRPRALPWQRVLSESIVATPEGARRRDAQDHFGNMVTWLFLDGPHADFVVTAESMVDVSHPPPPQSLIAWEAIADAARDVSAGSAAEYRFESPMVPLIEETRSFALESFPPGRSMLEGLLDLNDRFYHDFSFRAGVTMISTPISQVMKRREGVCQDFSHAMVSALRGLGLPERYN